MVTSKYGKGEAETVGAVAIANEVAEREHASKSTVVAITTTAEERTARAHEVSVIAVPACGLVCCVSIDIILLIATASISCTIVCG